MNPRDGISKFYQFRQEKRNEPIPEGFDGLSSISRGLGDMIVGTAFFRAASAQNKKRYFKTSNSYFEPTIAFNPFYLSGIGSNIFKTEALEHFYAGNGHLAQMFQRVLGLTPELKPRGNLIIQRERIKTRIGFHFDVGGSAQYLKHLHIMPRQVYSNNLATFQEFMKENPQFEFVQFGMNNFVFEGAKDFSNRSINDSIRELASCEYFIGVNSGFMNVAAALDIKSIIIVNLPFAHLLYLPCMKTLPIPDLNWLYPQNVHLHQDGSNELVPEFSKQSLTRAINGEIYPFWRDNDLDLIYD